MANIVEGLFGLTPSQVRQQQQAQINAQAAQYAQADPFQRATMGMYQGGAGLAGIGAGMMGMQNKDVAAAQEQQQFASQIDMTTPEGVMEGAKAAQARGDSAMAVKLVALARQMQEEQSTAAYRDAQAKQMLASAERQPQVEPMEIEKLYAALSKAEQAGNQPLANSIKALISNKTRVIGGGRVGGGAGVGAATKAETKKELAAKEKAAKSSEYLDSKMAEIEYSIADQLGLSDTPEKLREYIKLNPASAASKLESAVGFIQGRLPAMSQETEEVRQHITRLKDLAQTIGISELRQAGIAPGSITEKEWPKFQASMANINENLSGPALLTQYKRILKKFDDVRSAINVDRSPPSQPTTPPPAATASSSGWSIRKK